MDRREAEEKIRQMSITEQITRLSETAASQVIDHIEQAVLEEHRTTGSKPPVEVSNTSLEHDT